MLKILENNANPSVVETVATGTLSEKDYAILIPMLEKKIDKYGKISWLFEMNDFTGWEAKAFWSDFKFDIKHNDDFKRIAMVGETAWQAWMTNLMKPFTSAQIRFFDLKEKAQAQEWLMQDL